MTEPTDITTMLAVIDATLAGEAVAPEHAELAELSLILTAEREVPSAAFAAELDGREARRFSRPPSAAGSGTGRSSRWQWLFAPGAAVGVAALVAVIVVVGGGGRSGVSGSTARQLGSALAPRSHALPRQASNIAASSSSASSAGRALSFGRPSGVGATSGAASSPRNGAASSPTSGAGSSAANGDANGTASGAAGQLTPASGSTLSPAPTPSTAGRQIVQSAQVSLSTPPSRVDYVAQQVFDVVAAQNGVVQNSNITSSTTYGNAQFSLSVPSANLSRTLNALSQLHGANVVSRSDATQDITGQVGTAGTRLAEARALRTSLLRQLAAATTATAVSSLKAQLGDVDASISSDLGALHSLQRKVAYSQISVTINSVAVPLQPVTGSGGGFTLSRASHDAGRVLVVAAGVALIGLAVLIPLGLVLALGLWASAALRRRRREQALDLI